MRPVEGTKLNPESRFRIRKRLLIVPGVVDIPEILEMEEHLKTATENHPRGVVLMVRRNVILHQEETHVIRAEIGRS